MQQRDKNKPRVDQGTLKKALQKKGMQWFLLFYGDYPDEAFSLNLNKAHDQDHLRSLVDLVNESSTEPFGVGWGICEFKNEEAYRKGRRLVGQHHQLSRERVWKEPDADLPDWSESVIEFYLPAGMSVEAARDRWLSSQEAKKPKGKWERPTGIQLRHFQGLVQPLGYTNLPLNESEKKAIQEEHQFRGYSVAKLAGDWDVSESLIRKVLRGHKPPVSPSRKTIKKGVSETEPPVPGREVLQDRGSER